MNIIKYRVIYQILKWGHDLLYRNTQQLRISPEFSDHIYGVSLYTCSSTTFAD